MTADLRTQTTASGTPSKPLGFGRVFTEHMLCMTFDAATGWQAPQVQPYAPILLDPATSALHYGQMVFEGLKAFRGADDTIRLFRLEAHAARFRRSCERLCIPPIPEETFIEAVQTLVGRDAAWVPTDEGASLYIRPFVFATDPFLGVRPAQRYTFLIILSPVGAYYDRGFAPVRIWVEQQAVRAAQGGLGMAKTAANYAASLGAAARAKARGFDQVLWTDAAEHRYLEEVGTMNLFVHLGDEVVTPSLDGTILPGITRDSVIRLLRDRGMTVVERKIPLEEVVEAHEAGTLREIFGTGTAAVISPVGALGLGERELTIGGGVAGPLSLELFEQITGIQRGLRPDPHDWVRAVR